MAHMMNLPPALTPSGGQGLPPVQNGSAVKTKVCNKFKTAEGCKFGDKCHFAHGEWELGRPIASSLEDPRVVKPMQQGRFGGRIEAGVPASFGASATAKIIVDGSLAGAVIGKGGVNSKHICRQTRAKLSIREHETDLNLRNIELEGSLEQIQEASAMVRQLIVNIGSGKATSGSYAYGSNFKTKLCENFTKGSCTFGDRCHFAHGAAELRKTG